MATPNMNLTLPLVSQTPGPTWASQINSDLTLIDAHDHAEGRGAPITPAGININSDLGFNSHSATGLQSVQLEDQLSLTSTNTIYTLGGDLYYNNGSSTPVQITAGGSLGGAAGTITGLPSGTASASFSGGTGTFTFNQATNTGAVISSSTLKVRSTAASSNSIDITTPVGTAGYTLTLPIATPVSGYSLMGMAASGAISLHAANSTITLTSNSIGVGTITSSNIDAGAVGTTQLATGAVTPIKMAAVVSAVTASSGTLGRTDSSFTDVFLNNASITGTANRPIVLQVQADGSSNTAFFNSPSGNSDLRFKIIKPDLSILYVGFTQIPAGYKYPGNLTYIYTPTQTGTFSFNLQGQQTSGLTWYVSSCVLYVHQL